MTKSLPFVFAAGLLAASPLCLAQPVKDGTPLAIECSAPLYPKEALRYELTGDTAVDFDLDAAGRVENARVRTSSGWKLLDNAAVAYHRSCRHAAASEGAPPRVGHTMLYKFQQKGERREAEAVLESCPASDKFTSYKQMAPLGTEAQGLQVRLLVSPQGVPFDARLEGRNDPALARAALQFVEACRFKPATLRGTPVHGASAGRIGLKAAL